MPIATLLCLPPRRSGRQTRVTHFEGTPSGSPVELPATRKRGGHQPILLLIASLPETNVLHSRTDRLRPLDMRWAGGSKKRALGLPPFGSRQDAKARRRKARAGAAKEAADTNIDIGPGYESLVRPHWASFWFCRLRNILQRWGGKSREKIKGAGVWAPNEA